MGTATSTTNSITIPITANSDSHSQIDSTTCVYGTSTSYGETGTISNNTCTISGLNSGTTYFYKITATDNAGNTTNETGSKATLSKPISDIVNVGDYIYMRPTKTSYSITSSMTGCVRGLDSSYCNGIDGASQRINPSELTVWRVIKINTDGTVDVVSDSLSSKPVYFYSWRGYDSYLETLSTIAAQYTSNYVASARFMSHSTNSSNVDDVDLVKAAYADVSGYSEKLVAKTPSGVAESYWLDRQKETNYDTYSKYYLLYIAEDGRVLSDLIFNDDTERENGDYDASGYLRPILTLKSTVKIIGGTGTKSDNYRLGL